MAARPRVPNSRHPKDVAADTAGNLVIADTENSRIRVVAGSTGTFYGKPMTAGDIYTVAGERHPGFAGDGSAATKAEMWWPEPSPSTPSGDLLIADTLNSRIRIVG